MHWICDRSGTDTARGKADMERGGVAEPASQSKVQTLRGEVDELSDKMKENMKGIIKKGEKVVDLLTRSENMKKEAEDFKYRSKEVESKYWWKNVKPITVIVVVVLIVILIIILLATGVIPVSAPVPPVVTSSSKP
ncbi:vesicle-associated membrane protein 8-like [Epinephelus lanceolatus]